MEDGGGQRKISARTTRLNKVILGQATAECDVPAFGTAISREGLLDSLFVLYDECSKDVMKKKDKTIADFVNKYRNIIKETRNMRVNTNDFDVKSLIGKGYFGEVYLVKEKRADVVYAMKKMRKSIVTSAQVREERDIMATRGSPWLTSLQYAFQDQECLYLVMEYLPGGDLLGLMIRVGVFDEELAQFYLAELTEALHSLHELGYVHRDIKPENILLDRFGHIKLADFGNATVINRDGSVTSMTPVGTPDYIAPELLQILSTTSRTRNSTHDVTCDFWSMGIIGYEFVTKTTPFHDDNLNETYSKIVAHCEGSYRKKLSYPNHVSVSGHYRDLIDRLVTPVSNRMSYAEIVSHPFFNDVNWDKLQYRIAPIVPSVSSADDTSNFEDIDKSGKRKSITSKSTYTITKVNDFSGHDLPFLGYTYVYEEPDPAGNFRDSDEHMAVARLSAKVKEQERMMREHAEEMHQLQRDLLERERKIASVAAHSKMHDSARQELENMKELLKQKTSELAAERTDNKTLRNTLRIEKEQRARNDATIADVVKQTYKKWEKAKQASDHSYEKQIAEAKSEIHALMEQRRETIAELTARVKDCEHWKSTVDNYKDLLTKTTEKHLLDKDEVESSHVQLVANYEMKIQEYKSKWKAEKEQRANLENELREIKREMDELTQKVSRQRSSTAAVEAQRVLADNVTRRMTMQLEENNMLRQAKQQSDRMCEERDRICDELRSHISKLQEQASSVSSQRSSMFGQEFRSANSSINDLTSAEEQLRNDLVRARERENVQRQRADGLEEVVSKLEAAIEQLKQQNVASGAETFLERQNERLEDKLTEIREQALIDKQSARTANLALWKLEKELENLRSEKGGLTRRIELADERVKRVRQEKEELEGKMAQNRDMIANRDKQIDDLKQDIRALKDELRRERELWSTTEKDRLAEKTELIECVAKIQVLEERLGDSRKNYNQANDKVKLFTAENARLLRELDEARDELSDSLDTSRVLEAKLLELTKQYNMLKGACSITETQLTEIEAMLEKERKHNGELSEKKDELRKQLKEKEEANGKLRVELHQERSSKTLSDSRSAHVLSEYDELRKKFEDLQQQMVAQQKELIEKTSDLFEGQETIEILKHDSENMQKLVANYEHERHILKEEKSRILTDLYLAKEHITKQNNEMKDYRHEINQLTSELEHVKQVLQEQKTFYTERDIRNEATLEQHKKLIDYLQLKVEENAHKKKKTFADMIFGSSGAEKKENMAPNVIPVESTVSYKKLQDELQKERSRTMQLQEKLLQAKTSEIVTKKQKEELEQEMQRRDESVPRKESIKATVPAKKKSPEKLTVGKAHTFDMTCETPSSKTPTQLCGVCDRHIMVGHAYWKCTDCGKTVHRKCRASVTSKCGAGGDSDSLDDFAAELVAADGVEDGMALEVPTSAEEKPEDDKYVGDLLFKTKRLEPRLVVNDIYEAADGIVLLGCETGLFSYNLETSEMVHIKGIANVKSFAISPAVPKAILIGADGEYLYQCDLNHLQARAQAAACLAPKLESFVLDLSIANRTHNERFHLVRMMDEVSSQHQADAIAIAATASRIVILKFMVNTGRFTPVRGLDTALPVSTVLFTKHTAIVNSDKFFEIDLRTFEAEEFLDMSDVTLRDVAGCRPLAAFRINGQELLLCFREVGIFVDEYGCSSRPQNIHWLQDPLQFQYRASCLFIAHADCVQVRYVSKSFTRDLERRQGSDERSAFVRLHSPKLLSFLRSAPTSMFVACECGQEREQEIVILDGCKVLKSAVLGFSSSMETLSSLPTTDSRSQNSLSTLGQDN